MKSLVICTLFLSYTALTSCKQISLEDIERDNLKNEKKLKPSQPAPSPTEFGFVPTKTAANYVAKSPKPQYIQPQYSPQQYSLPAGYPIATASQPTQYSTQYTVPSYQYAASSSQYTAPSSQYAAPSSQYATPGSGYSAPSTQYATPGVQYAEQPAPDYYIHQPSSQEAQYNLQNVQYITDNSISQQQYQSGQQYVYLQQYPSSSTSVQTVVDPKTNQQYIMYIPTYPQHVEPSQNVEYVEQPQYISEQQHQQEYLDEKPGYVHPETTKVEYKSKQPIVQQTIVQQPIVQQPIVQEPIVQQPVRQQSVPQYYAQQQLQYVSNREPKSLLDSYVPSYLQLRYYKQQQQNQANAISQSYKFSQPITGKTEYVKSSYRPHSLSSAYKRYARTS